MEKLKKYWPYQIIIIAFFAVAYLFTPQVFRDEVVNQSDIASWRGMANEIIEYNEAHPGEDPALWTNSMFSGMPSTTISVIYEGDYTDYLYKAIHKIAGKRPPAYLLISLIGAFMMLMAFGVNIWLAAIGAFAITFCSYNMQIMQVGHNSKMVAIAFMPWVMAALAYAYRRKPFAGAVLFAFALSFQIKANHPQITYYLAIIVLGYALAQLFNSVREKALPRFIKTSMWLLVAGLLGVAVNVNHLWPTYEYSRYTMRGGSELAQEQGKNQKGLDISYATSWSYSPQEMPNLMIPDFNGGASAGELSRSSETYKTLQAAGYSGANQIIKQMPLYWGPQPFTAGPMYIGAISIFIFILGLFLLKGAQKWWIVSVSLLAVLLSWGANLMFLTEFFFNHIPLYSKFRTVSMILVILHITVPLLAFVTLHKIMFERQSIDKSKFNKGLYGSLAITAGLSFIFILMPSLAGSFVSSSDGQLPEALRGALVQDRIALLRSDSLRTIFFVLAAAAALWFGYSGKIKRNYLLAIIALLFFADLWFVGHRYLNDSHFVKEREFRSQYALRPVDKLILEDTDPSYRVLDLSVNTFNDSHVSYHHKTIGGYSPAKLQIYQDMIDVHLFREMEEISRDISGSTTLQEAQTSMGFYPALSMLNARYFVIGAENAPLVNRNAFGNAWLVSNIFEAKSLSEEIEAIDPEWHTDSIDLRTTAIVHSDFITYTDKASTDSLSPDEHIRLTDYSPNRMLYSCNVKEERVALFSEIYYPAGWKAYIDGTEVPLYRANYLLRAVTIPAGSHKIEFVFSPESFTKGSLYSSIISVVMLLLLFFVIVAPLLPTGKRKSNKAIGKND